MFIVIKTRAKQTDTCCI